MKHLIFFIFLTMLVTVSCQKEFSKTPDDSQYAKNVRTSLQDSMGTADFASLDFTRIIKTHIDSGNIIVLRIGFKQKSIASDFVLLQTNEKGECLKGRIISLNGSINERHQYNGSVLIEGLRRNLMVRSAITNGFVEAFLMPLTALSTQRLTVQPDPFVELPEVVITASYPSSGGISWSTWISVVSFFNDFDYGVGYGFYSFDGLGGGGGGGSNSGNAGSGSGNGSGGSVIYIDEPIQIDFENQYDDPAIDLAKYMKCFTDIPNGGATGSIEIFTDIPVNGDPSKFFDWSNGSPGHTFIQLRKQNGGQSVSQNIGFYPKTGWKTTISPAPIDGKWVDNQGHEFNASYKVNLTAEQVQNAVIRILYLSHFIKYDIDEYNCTDWALDVFNETVNVQQHLNIERYDIPGGEAAGGTSTPNGLYNKLTEMKNAGGPAAANIVIPIFGLVGQSHGPCN